MPAGMLVSAQQSGIRVAGLVVSRTDIFPVEACKRHMYY